MNRRRFLINSVGSTAVVGGGGLLAWHQFFDGPLFNPCDSSPLPDRLRQHELVLRAIEGLDTEQLWDCHFHLIGDGLAPGRDGELSGIWLNPGMRQWRNFTQRLQYGFYLDAACLTSDSTIDQQFVDNVTRLLNDSLIGSKFMLLAFDYQYNNGGEVVQNESTFYVPNSYAAKVANTHNQLEWIGSVHPYREDALEALDWCAQKGARAIKWLPPAMNIDPASSRCNSFYEKLVELKLPLLTHAGEEKAVHSEELQSLSNPLLLRTPLDKGVKIIVAHCASLGKSEDIESQSRTMTSNFELFARLMNDSNYSDNLLADISAINLINRDISEVKTILENQAWHERLLYASDYPLPGVMPIVSSTYLASKGLLNEQQAQVLTQVRRHNVWLFDLLQKRMLASNGVRFSDQVFATRRHFI